MMSVLQDLEISESEPADPVLKPRSFDEAMNYTFTNFDNALRKLAQ